MDIKGKLPDSEQIQSEGDGQDPKPIHLDPDKAAELIAQKQKANREAQTAKQQLKEMQAMMEELRGKVQSYEDAGKSEAEKLAVKAQQYEQELNKLRGDLQMQRRMNVALQSGTVDAELLALALDKMLSQDDSISEEEAIEQLKKSKPHLFKPALDADASDAGKDDEGQALDAGQKIKSGGGPAQSSDTAARVKELKDAYLALKSKPFGSSPDDVLKKAALVDELKELTGMTAQQIAMMR